MILQFVLICEFSPAIYISYILLFIGHINFYYGMLFNNTFIKFRDYWADWMSEVQFEPPFSIVLSQWAPKFTRQFSISESCFGSMFSVRLSIIINKAFKATVMTSKSSLWQSFRIYMIELTSWLLKLDLNSSSAKRLIIIPKQ